MQYTTNLNLKKPEQDDAYDIQNENDNMDILDEKIHELDEETAQKIDEHIADKANPHEVTKSQVGLGSVVNTGDSETPVSGGTTKFTTGGAYTELGKKMDVTSVKTIQRVSSLPSSPVSTTLYLLS